jgi:hypothetical protein
MNSSDMYDEIYNQDFNIDDSPHCWIQWKGTIVCMDFHCICGHIGHIDGDFCYYAVCPKCQRKYAVGQNVKLIELTETQAKEINPECLCTCIKTIDDYAS